MYKAQELSKVLSQGGGREEVKAPPGPCEESWGPGDRGTHGETHSVEHNAKNSVHPLDEATEYLVSGVQALLYLPEKNICWVAWPSLRPWAVPCLSGPRAGAGGKKAGTFSFPSRVSTGGGKVGLGPPARPG